MGIPNGRVRNIGDLSVLHHQGGFWEPVEHGHSHPMISFYSVGVATDISESGRRTELAPYMVNLQPRDYRHALEPHGRMTSICAEFGAEFVTLMDDYHEAMQRPTLGATARVMGICRRIECEIWNGDMDSDLILQSLYFELIHELSRKTFRESRTCPSWVYRAQDLMRDRFKSPPSLAQMAAELDVHPVEMCRVFKKETGHTVGEYLREVRTQYAARKLMTTAHHIRDIASDAGFTDHSTFAREFRKRATMSPSRFRNARAS